MIHRPTNLLYLGPTRENPEIGDKYAVVIKLLLLKGGARGNGFRLDHCFATPSLVPRITACRYSHREREAGVSGRSLVIVDVE
jgi:hypothetical protein